MTLLKRPATETLLELPLIGRVMAGQPVEVFEAHEPILIPPMLLRTGTHLVMQVMGDSMIDDGICACVYVADGPEIGHLRLRSCTKVPPRHYFFRYDRQYPALPPLSLAKINGLR
jgi:hypothetical protein